MNAFSSPVVAGGLVDFTGAAIQDPLSMGGTWTNDTQGTGGNVAMNAQSSMQVMAAASGGINIAGGDNTGQDVPPAASDYRDSFAFLPGFGSGNKRITATMYVLSGYSPAANHEIELLLGCSSTAGNREWVSCTWDRTGIRAMARMSGPANGYTILSPTDSGALPTPLNDLDVWMAEVYPSTNTVLTYRNGVLILSYTGAEISGLGNGLGIGSFRRTIAGGTAANAYGYRSVLLESF